MRLDSGLEPLPKFVLGEDADLREWLVHLHEPRFACRVREDDFTDAEVEAPEFYIYQFGGGSAFSDFQWFDPRPETLDDLGQLLDQAADFVEAFDEA